MNKSTGIIVAAVVVLGLGIGVFALTQKSEAPSSDSHNHDESASETTTPSISTENAQNNAADHTDPQSTNTITYGNDGFSPASLTVKSGSTVTVKNDSTRVLQFASGPHPQHTDNPEINAGSISPGQSKTVTVTKTGSHGYHNHLNEDHAGMLIVE